MAGKKRSGSGRRLFRDPSGQSNMFDKSLEEELDAKEEAKVECLGMTFDSEEERRQYFLERLREKLQDPEFRKIPGFPKGSDEAILRMSDPPWYTACPNPFLRELICDWRSETDERGYSSQPFAADVSEGRTDDVYTAHTYHTKVPPRAIARYLFHYTQPGDVVLDAFSGTGMTGVAAGMCSDRRIAVECQGTPGARRAVLLDLSPLATFVSSVYLCPPSPRDFQATSQQVMDALYKKTDDIWHVNRDGESYVVEFHVWAEQFTCPNCQAPVASAEMVEATVTIGTAKEFSCPRCSTLVSKAPSKKSKASKLERRLETALDPGLGGTRKLVPRQPLFFQARLKGERIRRPVLADEAQRLRHLRLEVTDWYPTDPLIQGERFLLKDCNAAYGITHVHHFYLPRQLKTYSALWRLAQEIADYGLRNAILFFVQTNALSMTLLNRFGPTHHSQVNRYFSGTLYIPSVTAEVSPRYAYENKRKRLIRAFGALRELPAQDYVISTQSSTNLSELPDNSVDYIFIDPPFGRNLQYSELNQIWESWLAVKTSRDEEAIIDSTRGREIPEYVQLITSAFLELFRVLRTNRWMTVEFHNSSNAVWIGIQEALQAAGFVVADVRGLSKEMQTYKQSRQGLMKQDLVISAYKPTDLVEQQVRLSRGSSEGAMRFIEGHLQNLPIFVEADGEVETNQERQPNRLFDRMVAFHVQRGLSVPYSLSDFSMLLQDKFPSRDGMFFLPQQVAEYDRKRAKASRVRQMSLFVDDEESAIRWLRQELERRPRSSQELQPEFLREAQTWAKHEVRIDLEDLLEGSFLRYQGLGPVPRQLVSYLKQSSAYRPKIQSIEEHLGGIPDSGLETNDQTLIEAASGLWYVPDPNRQGDLEKARERQLLREFEEYRGSKERKLKEFRTEAVRAGFKGAYDKQDYETILDVGKKLPERVLQEDEKLLMYYDVASMRAGEE